MSPVTQSGIRQARSSSGSRAALNPTLEFARAAVIGLSDAPRWLPCTYLYDARGSELFEKITQLPEYYPTRTEASILERHAKDVAEATGPVTVVELGSGSSLKTDHLLDAYQRRDEVVYVPIDVSAAAIEQATTRIEAEFGRVTVEGIVGTYDAAFSRIAERPPVMVVFLGSTIGNFNQTESYLFWNKVSRSMKPGDYFLLGVDLVKDQAVLEAAYNDAQGITAEFTKNLFVRMNRELGSGIDLANVEHVAQYDPIWQRIETFGHFRTDQTVHIRPLDVSIDIAAGDQVMIEISRKFRLDDLPRFLERFGLRLRRVFTDEQEWFGVLLLEQRG